MKVKVVSKIVDLKMGLICMEIANKKIVFSLVLIILGILIGIIILSGLVLILAICLKTTKINNNNLNRINKKKLVNILK